MNLWTIYCRDGWMKRLDYWNWKHLRGFFKNSNFKRGTKNKNHSKINITFKAQTLIMIFTWSIIFGSQMLEKLIIWEIKILNGLKNIKYVITAGYFEIIKCRSFKYDLQVNLRMLILTKNKLKNILILKMQNEQSIF